MLHSTWPRLRSTATCCCARGARLYSSSSSNRTLPNRPGHASAQKGRTRTDRNPEHADAPPRRPAPPLQRKLQAARQLRRKLAEGKLSWEEQLEAAAQIEGIDHASLASGEFGSGREPEGKAAAQTGQETEGAAEWPLLKRREPNYGYMVPMDAPTESSQELVAATKKALAKNQNSVIDKAHIMLKIDGLSTNVKPSDFYRIAENDLSKWNQSIRKIQQVRDKTTFEPTGTYNITFSTSMAAVAYAARFKRLHALALIKAHSKTGLWRSEVPPALLPAGDDHAAVTQDTLEVELAQFTIASGAQPVTVEHKRVVVGPEARKLSSMLAGDGLGEWPPVVLLEVSPRGATPTQVSEAVAAHGAAVGASWATHARVHAVGYNLHSQLERLTAGVASATAIARGGGDADDQDPEFNEEEDEGRRGDAERQRREKLRKREDVQRVAQHLEGAALRRFVLGFRDRGEAHRFHRMWNARWLGGEASPPEGQPRYFVRTQVIEF